MADRRGYVRITRIETAEEAAAMHIPIFGIRKWAAAAVQPGSFLRLKFDCNRNFTLHINKEMFSIEFLLFDEPGSPIADDDYEFKNEWLLEDEVEPAEASIRSSRRRKSVAKTSFYYAAWHIWTNIYVAELLAWQMPI